MKYTALLPLAVTAVYNLPRLFPEPNVAQYILRGWLGCLFVWALYRQWKISASCCCCVAAWEASTSICGAVYAELTPALEGLCDKGTGIPFTLPLLALSLLAVMHELKQGGSENE